MAKKKKKVRPKSPTRPQRPRRDHRRLPETLPLPQGDSRQKLIAGTEFGSVSIHRDPFLVFEAKKGPWRTKALFAKDVLCSWIVPHRRVVAKRF